MPYFDFNATAPLHPVAREAWLKASAETWQNPGGPYRDGARAQARLAHLRERMADLLGAHPDQVVFTSGATEADNAVLAGVKAASGAHERIAVSRTEHPAVLEAAHFHWEDRVSWLEVDRSGQVDEDALREILGSVQPRLTCVMAANNETGVLAPVERIAAICRSGGSPYLCDATQWIGKLSTAALETVDYLVGGAHKFGGPKGVGFLRLPSGGSLASWIRGGRQENGHRAGTENIPSVAAMVEVLTHLTTEALPRVAEKEQMRREFEARVKVAVPGLRVVGEDAERLWNTVSVIMPRGDNSWWARRLDARGFQVATGSACSSGDAVPSHVLQAQGIEAAEARRMVRLSAGWSTTPADWADLEKTLAELAIEQSAPPVVRIVDPGK